ncbi:MAG: substrate-binding domain-containing protein [Chloroflexota bacterium]
MALERVRSRWHVKAAGVTLALAVALGAPGWLAAPVAGQDATPAPMGEIILATTTSTADSGLLDALAPLFLEESGITLKPIAVGSGAALELGQRGEADVLLVHSPAAEEEFMAGGFGETRTTVMFNDFVIVGPEADPAKVGAAGTAVEAMAAIAAASAPFVSRGDDSGTHALEKKLWAAAGIEPAGAWYTESGSGMADTLKIASERQAYTVTDRGTWLSLGDAIALPLQHEGDAMLRNVYHVITVNPANGPGIDTLGAAAFRDFLLAPETQAFIGKFGADRFGQALFTPCANGTCAALATPAAGS